MELDMETGEIKKAQEQKELSFRANKTKSMFIIFAENDFWRFYWDNFILLFALWNSILIPVAVFFKPVWGEAPWYTAFDEASNWAFILDILIQFNTSYYDLDGEEV